jgi:2-polyprenyl-3-methyl-5-hydroxy-6-metoxy-1,4-benzoquinol methylase
MQCRRGAATSTVDMRPLTDFVLAELPPTPARVLEVGCGAGELARTMDGAGYDVVAIDPGAPEGAIFRRIKLDELDPAERFDAAVAAFSLHHVTDLGVGLDRIRDVLRPGGLVLVEEIGFERLDRQTAEWFHGQRRALVAAGRLPAGPRSVADCRREWDEEHVGLHGADAVRSELAARFRQRSFSWQPALYRYLDGVAAEALERTLVEADAIRPLGFRYVGERSA